jgi:hypothetical protein
MPDTPTPANPDSEPNKSKDQDAQGNTAASGTGPTQAVFEGDTTPGGADPAVDTTAVVSDTSNDDANPKNDPSDDKVRRELEQNDRDGEDPSHVTHDKESPVVKDNGVDLFAASDTGPNRQGNAYGIARDSVENFKRDLEDERDRLNQRLDAIEKELDELELPEGDTTNINIAKQREAEEQGKDRSEV